MFPTRCDVLCCLAAGRSESGEPHLRTKQISLIHRIELETELIPPLMKKGLDRIKYVSFQLSATLPRLRDLGAMRNRRNGQPTATISNRVR